MLKKLTTLVAILASLFQTQTIYAGTPSLPNLMFGDSRFIYYNGDRHVYVNTNLMDNWFIEALVRETDPAKQERLRRMYEIPETQKTILVFRSVSTTKPEQYYVQLLAAGALQSKKRFVLINVEQTVLDLTAYKDKQYRTWPHLGMLYVGTVAYEEGYEVVLWDELVQGYVDLPSLVEPGDVVGFSLVVTGIERGVKLARAAKRLGAECIIVGNDSAAFRSNELLSLHGRPIDAVFDTNLLRPVRLFFMHYGKYFTAKDLRTMRNPGMIGRQGHANRTNEQSVLITELAKRKQYERADSFELESPFMVPKFDLFPPEYWQEVWSNYAEVFGHKHRDPANVKNAIALLAQGCTRTQGTDVCSYCTIADVADIRIPSEDYLRRTLQAYDEFGIKMVFNTTDSAYEMAPLVKRLQNVNARFDSLIIYGRAQGIAQHPELMDSWRAMVDDRFLVNVGMDSGDARILSLGVNKSSLGKGSRLEENIAAVNRIKESGAHLHYSLIFGSPGETVESCERTLEFLQWTIQTLGPQLDLVETDLYWLNFGSPASRIFRARDFEYAETLAAIAGKTITREEWQQDFVQYAHALTVPVSVEEAWYHHFTNIDMATAQAYNAKAAALMAAHEGSITGRAFKPHKEG